MTRTRAFTQISSFTLVTSRGVIDSRVKAGQSKLGKIEREISGSSLAAYLAAVEAGTLETLQVNQVKPAAPKISSTIEKLRGWLGGT